MSLPVAQVHCSVLCKGPSGVALNGSYSNRASAAYKRDLGAAILEVAHATPRGMLVFFPSYAAMKAITDEWRACGLLKQLEAAKPVLQEPRTAREFQPVRTSRRYQTAFREPARFLAGVSVHNGNRTTGDEFFARVRCEWESGWRP